MIFEIFKPELPRRTRGHGERRSSVDAEHAHAPYFIFLWTSPLAMATIATKEEVGCETESAVQASIQRRLLIYVFEEVKSEKKWYEVTRRSEREALSAIKP